MVEGASKIFFNFNCYGKQILAISVSTVVLEQEFSAGDNILDATRSFLSLDSIQVQACVDDWIKAQYWQQEIDQEQTYVYFENGQITRMKSSND